MDIPTKTFLNLESKKQERIINAAVNEFSKRSFEEAKLSNIIRDSNIPRGSFYQYFNDKKDIYHYIFEMIKNKKMEYLKDLLVNPEEISFLELFRLLYKQGIKFSMEHPEYVEIFGIFISSKGSLYNELIGEGLKEAKKYYIALIESDKVKGNIRKDVDSSMLADLVIQLTTNIAIDEFGSGEVNYDTLLTKINSLITIFKKGIE